MRKLSILFTILLLLSTFLAACGGEKSGTEKNKGADEKEEMKEGGIVTYAYAQPFAGILERGHYEGEDDDHALYFMTEGLVRTGDDLMPEPNLAEWEVSNDNRTITFHIKKGVKWHNGEELTAHDMVYTWEVIAHPDYTGKRYTNVKMIEGAEAYNKGKADNISGIKIIDDHTVAVTVTTPAPNTLSELWTYPMPKAHLENVPVKEIAESDQVRKNPVGLGPFKVKNIVPGEMIEFERFDDYWKGKPHLDGVIYKVVDGSMAGDLLLQGEIDIVTLPGAQAVKLKEEEKINLIEVEALSYSYLGFKLGHWDSKKKQNIMDQPKFADKKLRQAFAYALDRQGMIDSFSEGYGTVINAPEALISWAFPDEKKLIQYDYNPDKAKKMLDELGYKDTNDDGFREDPAGKEFTVNLLVMSGSEIAEPRAQYIIQNLKDVGIKARLQGGRLHDFNVFYDLIEEDDKEVELFLGAWGLSNDPDPTGLWKIDDIWNFPRWVNEKSEELIEKGISEEAMDQNVRKQIYQEWHEIFNEELPLIPLWSPIDVYGINKNVKNVQPRFSTGAEDSHLWWRSD